MAAALGLAAFAPLFAGRAAYAGPAFAGHSAAWHSGVPARSGPVMAGAATAASRQAGVAGSHARILRRFVPLIYGGYAPYYPPSVPVQQPAPAPIIIETTTPVNVNFAAPGDQLAQQLLWSGPKIIEIGKPKLRGTALPRIVYGTPLNCVATRAALGPGIYNLD